MHTATVTPRIYVACLASYNEGELFGEWIDATQSATRFLTCLSARPSSMQRNAIHDYEGFGAMKLSEYESIDTVAELAQAIDELGEIYTQYAGHVGADYASVEDFQEKYQGEFGSVEEWAEHRSRPGSARPA